jgi:hypothetical protein
MKNRVRIFLTILSILTASGCASVSLLHSAKDPAVAAKQYKKLLVVGIAEKTQMRQVFEEVFAGEVQKGGAAGIASYSITGVNDKLSRDAVVEAVKKTGADGVITTRLVGSSKKSDVRTGFVMVDRGVDAFYGGSVSYAEFVHQPVEVITSTQVSIETNLFDAGTGMMVWSGTSSAVNPEGIITITATIADNVIKALKKDGLL